MSREDGECMKTELNAQWERIKELAEIAASQGIIFKVTMSPNGGCDVDYDFRNSQKFTQPLMDCSEPFEHIQINSDLRYIEDSYAVSCRIKQRRTQLGVRQATLAKAINCKNNGSVSRLERGLSRLSVENLFNVSKILRCSVEYLLGATDDPNMFVPEDVKVSDVTSTSDKSSNIIVEAIKKSTFRNVQWKSSLSISQENKNPNSQVPITVVSGDETVGAGDRIRYRRNQLSISQEDLANRLNLSSRSSVARYENISKNINMTLMNKLSDALDCPTSYFMGVVRTTATTDDSGNIIAIDLPDFAKDDSKFFVNL